MPDRILRERLTLSPRLDSVSAEAERLFTRALVKCDDYGNLEAAPEVLLASCFPRQTGRLSPDRVARWRNELAKAGLWTLYLAGGRMYATFPSWFRHQRRRSSRPKYPQLANAEAICSGFSVRRGLPQFAANCGEVRPIAARARDVRGRASRVESRESRVVPGGNLPQTETEPEAAPPGEDRREDVKALLAKLKADLGKGGE